jgi:hypothetical protein
LLTSKKIKNFFDASDGEREGHFRLEHMSSGFMGFHCGGSPCHDDSEYYYSSSTLFHAWFEVMNF